MDSLIFAINAVAPIILMVAIGYILKKIGFMNESFAKMANKLMFKIFLPAMLFLNVYKIDSLEGMEFGYMLYSVAVLVVVFLCSIPLVILVTKVQERRGAILQATFRSNFALIGFPLAQSLYGEAGAIVATLLSAVVIPIFNIFAVISLSVFRKSDEKPSVRSIVLGIIKNPLILSVFAGVAALGIRALFVKFNVDFRLTDIGPVYTTLGYLSNLATPLALLVLGAQFEFSAVSNMKKEILFGALMRTLIVPALSLGAACIFFGNYFRGEHFAAFVALFATPVAVSSVPMAQEMDSDAILAGQLVVWTTLISAFSVFGATYILRLLGILV